jgi:hypothetical protein
VRGALVLGSHLFFLSCLVSGTASGEPWRVGRLPTDCPGGCHFHDDTVGGEDGGGIESAMLSPGVQPGDTVMVYPGGDPPGPRISGVYSITTPVKSGVILISAAGPDSTVICGQQGGVSAISLANCSATTVVEGFTIRWDAQTTGVPGGGIACYSSSGTIRNNVFRQCIAGGGAAIYLQDSEVIVENNLFLDNDAAEGGGVIAVSGGAPIIRNNTLYRCKGLFGGQGAALYAVGADFTFTHNIVYGSKGCPAIFCDGTNTPNVTCNILWDNEFGPYGGLCVDSTGTSGNIVADPLFCDATPPLLPACTTIPALVDLRLRYGDFNFGVCADSPALTTGCGVIGYVSPFGNCASCRPTSVAAMLEPATWGRVKALYR